MVQVKPCVIPGGKSVWYLAAEVLPQARPARGALVHDRLFAAEHGETLGGVVLISGVNNETAHFYKPFPVVLVVVRRAIFIPASSAEEDSNITSKPPLNTADLNFPGFSSAELF